MNLHINKCKIANIVSITVQVLLFSKMASTVYTADDLFKAVEDNKPEKVKEIVKSGVDVHSVRKVQNQMPLHVAAELGHLEVVKVLVEDCEADLNQDDKFGDLPIHNAASKYHTEVVDYLDSKDSDESEEVQEWLKTHPQENNQ